jgi:ketosteroid isomerase-like protein
VGDALREQVLDAERALQAAQRASDVDALDRLLHDDLLAVGPDGSLVGKAEDLAAHRADAFRIDELEEEDLRVLVHGADLAVTFVVVRIRGAIGDEEVGGLMRYTRTWTRDGGAWRVLAAHISPAG